MRRILQLIAACAAAVIVMASCGGGGGGGTTPNAANALSAPGTQAHNTVTVPIAANRKSYGTAQLVLKFPAVVTGKTGQAIHTLHGASAASRKSGRPAASSVLRASASATRRSPSYVDPTDPSCECNGNILDIFVDGTLVPNIDTLVGPDSSMYVQQSSDGTQSLAVPLYSNQANDIVVVEWDGYYDAVLAVGETYQGTFTPGSTINASLTMLMNTYYVGVLDIYNQGSPKLMQGGYYYGVNGSCSSPVQAQFGIYGADWLGNFVTVAGYGGTPTTTIVATPDGGSTSKAGQTGIPGLYQIDWDSNCDGVSVNATATNPAYAASSDAENYTAPNGGYGYANCYDYGGPYCPGGPYFGLWEMEQIYAPGWEPPQYEDSPPPNYIYGATTSGSVDFTASPNPEGTPD